MGKLTTEQILTLIGNEIKWCQENGQKPKLSENQEWFVLGLILEDWLTKEAIERCNRNDQ